VNWIGIMAFAHIPISSTYIVYIHRALVDMRSTKEGLVGIGLLFTSKLAFPGARRAGARPLHLSARNVGEITSLKTKKDGGDPIQVEECRVTRLLC
jgi:hypothetical protein